MIRYIATALLALLSFPASAALVIFESQLSGLNEFPVNNSAGTGSTTVSLNVVAHTLRVVATFSGLTGNTTQAHIHCCLSASGQPPTVGVATELPSFTGFPLGVKSGDYDHTFDTSLAGTFSPAFVTNNGGIAGAEAALLAGLTAGRAYLNIHSTSFTGGEIRGFPTPVPVPEPATYALLGMGLAGLGLILRRRQKVR